jgi:hypothetical protein
MTSKLLLEALGGPLNGANPGKSIKVDKQDRDIGIVNMAFGGVNNDNYDHTYYMQSQQGLESVRQFTVDIMSNEEIARSEAEPQGLVVINNFALTILKPGSKSYEKAKSLIKQAGHWRATP